MSGLSQLSVAELVAVLGAFFGALWALVKYIGIQHERRENERHVALQAALAGLSKGQEEQQQGLRALERDFLMLKADLPLQYVRREDYVRGQSVIEAKLDGLAALVQNVQIHQSFSASRKEPPHAG